MANKALSRGYFVEASSTREPPLPQPGRFLATTEDSGGAFVILEGACDAMGPSALHVHHDHDESMYILEGHVIVSVGDSIHHARVGDFVFLPKGVPHRLEFPEASRWLLIGSGGYDVSRGELSAAFAQGLTGAEIYSEIDDVDFVSE